MNAFVVDTNVAIVANGRDTHADISCQLSCVERLENLTRQGVAAVDTQGLILAEYAKHLFWSGGPGVGDAFFKFLVDRQHADQRVWQVPITHCEDERQGFKELPENEFDPSDRKFLAVAVVANAVVLNATDSDWAEQASLMEALDVQVDQLCPQHADK